MVLRSRWVLWALAMLLNGSGSAATTLSVNAGSVVNTFVPYHAFGTNAVSWADPRPLKNQVQAAGNFIIRFPGGSWADAYHWNRNGSYDVNGYWVPSSTTAGLGSFFASTNTYAASNVLDSNAATVWMSHPDTDFPNSQWVYLAFAAQGSVNKLNITWGSTYYPSLPYASKFTVQYWSPANGQQWAVYSAPTNGWVNTTAANWDGNGGAQTVTFTAVTTGYIRLRMTQSSAGAGGAYSVAELHPYNGATAITLASYNPAIGSSLDPATTGFGWVALSFDEFMTMPSSMTPKAEPLITVNTGTGTPQEAAAWVYYANIVKGYGIKYWEIGNEMGGDWEGGGPLNAQDYGRRYIAFVQAMKAVDPSIVCIGGAGAGYGSNSEVYDGKGYIKAFIDRLATDGGGDKAAWAEGIVVHDYPGYGATPAQILALPYSPTGGLPAMASSLATQLVNHPQASTVPIWITEYNSWGSGGSNDITVKLANGLFVAEYLGEFMTQLGSRAFSQYWALQNGGDAYTNVTGSDMGYLGGSGAYANQPHASYWAMQMVATNWASSGDTQTHQVVSSTSSQTLLRSYANLRPDGSLTLMVVNTSPSTDYPTTVNLSGFNPDPQAHAWTLSSTEYAWSTSSVPYHASPDTGPSYLTITGVSSSFAYTFPKYSLIVLKFDPVLGTPTTTPTISETFTLSPTGTISSTWTFSPSITETRTPSPSPTQTRTASPTRTTTASPTQSMTRTQTPLYSPTLTSTPFTPGTTPASEGSLEIARVMAAPNPVTGQFVVLSAQLKGSADGMRYEVFGKNMEKVLQGTRSGPFAAGWEQLSFDGSGLSNGAWYVALRAVRNSGEESKPQILKVVIVR